MKHHTERCKTEGCKAPLLSQSEHVTGLCFHCGDGEYHGDEDGTPRRSKEWVSYVGSDYIAPDTDPA